MNIKPATLLLSVQDDQFEIVRQELCKIEKQDPEYKKELVRELFFLLSLNEKSITRIKWIVDECKEDLVGSWEVDYAMKRAAEFNNGEVFNLIANEGLVSGPAGLLDKKEIGELYLKEAILFSSVSVIHPCLDWGASMEGFEGKLISVGCAKRDMKLIKRVYKTGFEDYTALIDKLRALEGIDEKFVTFALNEINEGGKITKLTRIHTKWDTRVWSGMLNKIEDQESLFGQLKKLFSKKTPPENKEDPVIREHLKRHFEKMLEQKVLIKMSESALGENKINRMRL